MILKINSYKNISKSIKSENKKIVVYGAGMIGQILVPYLIGEYHLEENLLFYVDGDVRKQGKKIVVGNIGIDIKPPNILKSLPKNTVLFITNSNYYPIVTMLDNISELNDNEAYIIPIIQVLNTHKKTDSIQLRKVLDQRIPKKIHYCWFSGNTMPDYLERCIESWYRYCPDYEIIRWDESNYDIESNLYMKQAYEAKKWGFVPDVARLDILYRYGGVYLDTDVELIKNLDDLLYQNAFAGVEKWGSINMGGCSGAVPGHPVIKKILDYRINERYVLEDGSFNQTTCGYYETTPLMMLGMKPNNVVQSISDMTIYSSEYFHPYDYMSGETTITENTFSIHHFNGGWLDESSMKERKRTTQLYKQMLMRMEGNWDE